MNSLDLILIVILLAYAVSGYVQGFVVNLIATIGLLVGGLLALAIVPKFLSGNTATLSSSLLALGLVVGAAAVGQGIGTYVGTDLRNGLKWKPLRWVDAVGGSVLSMVAVLCAGWALGYSVSGTTIPYLSTASQGLGDPRPGRHGHADPRDVGPAVVQRGARRQPVPALHRPVREREDQAGRPARHRDARERGRAQGVRQRRQDPRPGQVPARHRGVRASRTPRAAS